jgi:DNA-binding HxlR family transcriptional regulator
MSRTSLKNWPCSFARVADILGDKWTLLILRDAFYGVSTWSGFHKSLRVARNILSDRLDKLLEAGVLERMPVRPGVERYEYHLTDAGRELFPLVVSMTQWGDRWLLSVNKEPVRLIDREQGAPVQPVAVQARDGRYLRARDVTFEPGPGASKELHRFLEQLQDSGEA